MNKNEVKQLILTELEKLIYIMQKPPMEAEIERVLEVWPKKSYQEVEEMISEFKLHKYNFFKEKKRNVVNKNSALGTIKSLKFIARMTEGYGDFDNKIQDEINSIQKKIYDYSIQYVDMESRS